MSAGRGIVHSERTGAEARAVGAKLFGIQSWVALPRSHEEGEPAFAHYAEDRLPIAVGSRRHHAPHRRRGSGHALAGRDADGDDLRRRVACGGRPLPFDPTYEERGIYTVSGEIEIAGDRFGPHQLLVFRPGDRITVRATEPARLMLLGGEPMDGPRHIWWNFVSSRKERIEQAKADWKAARFDSVPGETEFIPLPDR